MMRFVSAGQGGRGSLTRRDLLPWLPLVVGAGLVAASPMAAQEILDAGAPVVGPESGALVVVGGAMRSPEIYGRFIQLAGGPDAHIVVIPTAGGEEEYDDFYQGLNAWRAQGARNLTVLHTTDRAVADSEDFVAPLKTAAAVFFFGGRQWRLVDAYGGTRTEREIREVLARGGVVGGSSAGASIQGSFLVRGDTETNEVMMGDHQVGFGYLRGVAIDQHVLRRNRHFDLIEVVEAHPELLGIGIDENTALVVQGDQAEVIGASYVLVYDNRSTVGDGGRFYFLAPGDRFDLRTREAVRPARTFRPVEGVERRPWRGR
ncbi:MAG: cyanophycinase [Gemmatimonadota bacterium]|nr:cyanophycinase [Gemmatimonadota bacterium]MDH5760129.1 cyanophycinase [Gemmatimonadota bacterium]